MEVIVGNDITIKQQIADFLGHPGLPKKIRRSQPNKKKFPDVSLEILVGNNPSRKNMTSEMTSSPSSCQDHLLELINLGSRFRVPKKKSSKGRRL